MSNNYGKPGLVLLGVAGRMGRTIAGRFLTDGRVELVGAVDTEETGKTAGVVAGVEIAGPEIVRTVKEIPETVDADFMLDFSSPPGNRANLEECLKRGLDVLIGATGFTKEDIGRFEDLSLKYSKRIVLVPNFTPGINLLMKFAREAAGIFERVEIIELHHDRKADAPSGTALHTARIIAGGRKIPEALTPEDRSRGRIEEEIPIHAVRLPGLLAHQEVLFGSPGEVLTIRHDTTDRSAFMSGIYLAIDKIAQLPPGFTMGLDWAFDL